MTTRPFTPHEAREAGKHKAITQIPDYVVVAVNNLLMKAFASPSQPRYVTILQERLIEEILRIAPDHGVHELTRSHIFGQKMLDIEVLYREQGWKVVYDKPAYNESGDASFEFTAP